MAVLLRPLRQPYVGPYTDCTVRPGKFTSVLEVVVKVQLCHLLSKIPHVIVYGNVQSEINRFTHFIALQSCSDVPKVLLFIRVLMIHGLIGLD